MTDVRQIKLSAPRGSPSVLAGAFRARRGFGGRTSPAFIRAQSAAPAVASGPTTFLTAQQLQGSLAQKVYDAWSNTYIKKASWSANGIPDSKYVRMDVSQSGQGWRQITTSEATGYGMLVSVLMGKENDFKSILAFYEHFINRDSGLMSWSISETGFYQTIEVGDKNSATDGDLDAAYALLLAGERWGGNYITKGVRICQALKDHSMNWSSHMPMVGSWAGDSNTVLEETGRGQKHHSNLVSRTNDWMPGHYLKFMQHDTDNAGFWRTVYGAVRDTYIQMTSNYSNGPRLVPDFTVCDQGQYRPVTGKILEKDPEDGYFSFNACRVPWRLAAYLKDVGRATAAAEGILDVMKAQQKFFESVLQSGNKIVAGYKLDGSPVGNAYESTCWSGPALALLQAMNASNGGGTGPQLHLQQQLEHDVESKWESYKEYYSDSVLLLSLLQSM